MAPSANKAVPFLVFLVLCTFSNLPRASATPRNETYDNARYQLVEIGEPAMSICLIPFEGAHMEAKLRLEVVPIGGDNIHLAGNVDVPKVHHSEASFLRYEFSKADEKIGLKVSLNNKELEYTAFKDMYSGRFNFKNIKFYIKGKGTVTYDCPEPPLPPATTTTTTAPGELINSTRYQQKQLTQSSMGICLMPQGKSEGQMRLEVATSGGGLANIHLAGKVMVPLQESGKSLLYYKVTTIDEEIVLSVTLNNKELPYESYMDTYEGRFKFNTVKFYLKGTLRVIYDCPEAQPPTTTTTTTTPEPTTTTTTTASTKRPTISTPPPPPKRTTTTPKSTIKPTSPTLNRSRNATPTPTEEKSWIWALGAVGRMPTLFLLALVLTLIVVVAVPAFILWRQKQGKTKKPPNDATHNNTANYTLANTNEPQNQSPPGTFNTNLAYKSPTAQHKHSPANDAYE